MADGPVIQKAGERAIANGVNLAKVLGYVREFRQKNQHTPVVLMGYANPVERYDLQHGEGAFVRDAAAAGLDGMLVVDYPPEECRDFAAALKARRHGHDLPAGTHQQRCTHPGNCPNRQRLRLLRLAQGRDRLGRAGYRRCRADAGRASSKHVHIPVGVGFGIRDGQTAHTVAQMADAVIIGSRIIQLLEDQPHEKVIPLAIDFLRGIRKAMDA